MKTGHDVFELADGQSLQVKVTEEGIILDLIRDGEVVATWGQTADEIVESLLS